MSVVYFLVLIGVLVMIHELGHFAAAKLLDFHVTRLSLGFGRPLLRTRLGETEYQVGVFPLGGYVRILGEDDEEPTSSRRAFSAKPLWQRLVVVFAGPVANFALPVVIYFVFFAGHSQLPAAIIGHVIEGTPAASAGLVAGDRVIAIDGTSVRYFEDLETAVQDNPGSELRLRVRRGTRTFEKYITPVSRTTRARSGASTTQGSIGVTWAPFLPQVGVIDPRSPAGRAGLATGDLVVSVDGRSIESWNQLESALGGDGSRHTLTFLRGNAVAGMPWAKLRAPGLAALDPETTHDRRGARTIETGLFPAEMFVSRVRPGTPASIAGLRAGDLITHLDGKSVHHWMLFEQRLLSQPDHTWTLAWRRRAESGELLDISAAITQERRRITDEYGNKKETLAFGAQSDYQRGKNQMIDIDGRLGYAVSRAIDRTGETISVLSAGFADIIRGRAPAGGPVSVYRAASVSGAKGLDAFLLMIAVLSVSVGLINLLPIPALDGGHLVVFAIEGVRQQPLSPRARDRIAVAGLAFVGLITVLALKNDVMRFMQ